MKKIIAITSGVLALTLTVFGTGFYLGNHYAIEFKLEIVNTDIEVEQEREDVFALLNEEIN